MARGSESTFDVVGVIRAARRRGDLSQRDLAALLGVSWATVARWESGRSCPSAAVIAEILGLAGLRLAVLDGGGDEVKGMRPDGVRDRGGRRRPAHLDVVPIKFAEAFRSDRPPREVRVSHRVRRDRDRARGVAGLSTEDHPSVGDLAAYERQLVRRRGDAMLARIKRMPSYQRWLALGQQPCRCPIECEETRGCVPGCPCACEPTPGHEDAYADGYYRGFG